MTPGWVQPPSRALCVESCRAACCRAPGSVWLTAHEATFMAMTARHALALRAEPGGLRLNFSENGGACPMLAADATCRIYGARPGACRRFPESPDPRCAVWPAQELIHGLH